EKEPAVRLSLDEIAFAEGATRRPLAESIADANDFIAAHRSWIIEGCYADIVEPLLPYSEKLIFLNPGVETCVSHCKARPWEPEKFESSEAQAKNLKNLIAWVRSYECRTDEYGLKRHRELYDSFSGEKYEFNDPSIYCS
ncbi:MAG: shikimate kinase, partial [Cyanobacteria bacterium P01_F01_bin.33]